VKSTSASIRAELKKISDPETARVLRGFFKTGPGEYGEGDVFIGIKVPPLRKISRRERALPLGDTVKLLQSKIHEERLLSLFILVEKFERGDATEQKRIYQLYLKNKKHINNWDLIDLSARQIVGGYLMQRDRSILTRLAVSKSIWDRRIAMLACYAFIVEKDFDSAIEIATILLSDEHDLIQKAVGWMLREIGNRDLRTEEQFLKTKYKMMPRTMLRYAIEKFPEKKRQAYLKGKI